MVWLVSLIAWGITLQTPPAPAPDNEDRRPQLGVSEFRASFRAAAIRSCSERLVGHGIPGEEIAMACPCMADHVLAAIPDDAGLVNPPPAILEEATVTCAAKAERLFGPTSGPK